MEMKTFVYLWDDKEEEDVEIKALVDSSGNLRQIDDNLANKNYTSDKGLNFSLPIYESCKDL